MIGTEQKDSIAILVALVMLLFLNFFVDEVGKNAVDFDNIYGCVTTGQFVDGYGPACQTYPPLFLAIAKFFSNRVLFFQQLALVMIVVIVPLSLYMHTRNPVTVWFYFSTTNFVFAALTASFFVQTFSMLLIISMLWMKDWQRIIILILSIVSHSTSFWFAIAFFILIKIEEAWKANPDVAKKIILGCSPIWGDKIPTELSGKLINTPGLNAGYITWNTIGSVFLKRTPIFFLIPALKSLIKNKRIALLGWLIGTFIAGFLIHERGFYFASWPMIIGLTLFHEDNPKLAKPILVLSGVFFLFNIYQAYNLISCA